MTYLQPFKQLTKENVDIAGGKGASLGEMTNVGIPVPPGFVILATAFDGFIKETGLNVEIEARIAEVDVHDMNSIAKASSIIRDVIHDTAMPEDIASEILLAFDELGFEFVAVRSSATAEDSSIASWAGELDTFLNTKREHVLEKIKECWS
ncbi:MAG: phosphoenolpyruvate synthase, partial [Candidatus Magasanikbacteria bacterium CG10_big_fil_rev_8_21_14_0_10_43_9]